MGQYVLELMYRPTKLSVNVSLHYFSQHSPELLYIKSTWIWGKLPEDIQSEKC